MESWLPSPLYHSLFAKQSRHVQWQTYNISTNFKITWMDHDTSRKITPVFILEAIKRNGRIVVIAFHLDSDYVAAGCHKTFRQQEIYFHSVIGIHAIRIAMKEKISPRTPEHLRNDVLHEHPLVELDFPRQNLPHCSVRTKCTVAEGEAHKQPSVCHVAFHRSVVGVHGKSNIGISHIPGKVDGHGCWKRKKEDAP